ncbi:MAG: cation transporter [Acidobacteria bacterium]|nr:cation transporter [Acidobacteriota bacterium]
MKRLSVPSIALVALVVAGFAVWSSRSTPVPKAVASPAAAAVRTQVFTVAQMTCATCPITVRTAMAGVKGVISVNVDFDTKKATVTFDPAIATPAAIARASTNAGYPASPIS